MTYNTQIADNQRATSLQQFVAGAGNKPATNRLKQVTEMVTETKEK